MGKDHESAIFPGDPSSCAGYPILTNDIATDRETQPILGQGAGGYILCVELTPIVSFVFAQTTLSSSEASSSSRYLPLAAP